MIIITCTRIMDVHNKHNFFVSVHIDVQWVKPAQPAESKCLIPTSLNGDPAR